MVVEGGMKCVKALLYVLLLTCCICAVGLMIELASQRQGLRVLIMCKVLAWLGVPCLLSASELFPCSVAQ